MSLQPGQKAPDFTLYDSDKKQVSLADYAGAPVVLLFFPFAFSRVCTAELCSVRNSIGVYNSLGAKVIGISVDSLYTLAKFKEEEQLNFTLLSDFNKEVSQAYGAFYATFNYGMKGVSKRAAFVIDKEATVQYAEILENSGEQPQFNLISEALGKIT